MRSFTLFDQDDYKWVVLGRDAQKDAKVIDSNQYAIITREGGMLLDPGGIQIFPHVLAELTRHLAIEDVQVIFSSHQDPDISSALSMWMDLCPKATVYCSRIWTSFISHFCMGAPIEFQPIPDEGCVIPIGTSGVSVEAVPAHYCHSSGNHSIFDSKTRILFSGDVGAALLPDSEADMFVEDFDRHVQYMEGFHLRWMPANRPLRAWVRRARLLDPEMICPQHGSIFRGEMVGRFLDWLESLNVERLDPMGSPLDAAERAA